MGNLCRPNNDVCGAVVPYDICSAIVPHGVSNGHHFLNGCLPHSSGSQGVTHSFPYQDGVNSCGGENHKGSKEEKVGMLLVRLNVEVAIILPRRYQCGSRWASHLLH